MDSTKSLLNKLKAERIGKSYNLVSLPSVALTEEEAPVWLRVNTLRTTRERLAAELEAEGIPAAAQHAFKTV